MSDDIFDQVLAAKQDKHNREAIAEFSRYITVMNRIDEGKAGDGVFLSAEECQIVETMCFEMQHFLAHVTYGACRHADGMPIYVIPSIVGPTHN
jgi:hypothetical protein